ncbi:hypothetical protein FZC79_17745 [Rossellomorea vietnamensis]|uniref:Uncharacterized protein n=1 Tax=Rossellomorea vietnamensis TaxID=218284 RepID=A0A5D4K8X0_9BACI|nr:hypothetical protein [Rossellomorea vietnamensis]TYR73718.1 hypothetical protein FZC79_17745 [Rossellomorea vietnamensis]
MNTKKKISIALIGSFIIFSYGVYRLGFEERTDEFMALPLIFAVTGLVGLIANLAKLKDSMDENE